MVITFCRYATFVTRTVPEVIPTKITETVTGYGSPRFSSLAPSSCRYHAFERTVVQLYRVRFAFHGEPQFPPAPDWFSMTKLYGPAVCCKPDVSDGGDWSCASVSGP
jgi:hypothetical protein